MKSARDRIKFWYPIKRGIRVYAIGFAFLFVILHWNGVEISEWIYFGTMLSLLLSAEFVRKREHKARVQFGLEIGMTDTRAEEWAEARSSDGDGDGDGDGGD